MRLVGNHLHRLRELSRVVGPARALWIAPAWSVSRRYLVIARDLREAIDLPGPGPELRCTEANRDEAKKLTQLDPRLTRMELDRRFTEGQICRIWWVDERIVHLRWFTDRRAFLPFLGLTFRPQDGDYLLYEVFTREGCQTHQLWCQTHQLVPDTSVGARHISWYISSAAVPPQRLSDHRS